MKKLLATIVAAATITAQSQAEVIFTEDFAVDDDLTQWVPNHAPLIGETIVVADGKLYLHGPNGNEHDNIWESILRSSEQFIDPGTYTLTFEIRTDIREVVARGFVSVGMPGGLEIRWWDWDNDGRLYYQGEEIATLASGARSNSAQFVMVQNGREIEIFKNSESIHSGATRDHPDFGAYNQIVLRTKFPVGGPTVLEQISMEFSPGDMASMPPQRATSYIHEWTLENSPSLHTVALEITGNTLTASQDLTVKVGMLDGGQWQTTISTGDTGDLTSKLQAEDFAVVEPGATETPLVLSYIHQLEVSADAAELDLSDISIAWVEERRVSYPWESDPEPVKVDDEGRTFWPGLHRNNGGHFAWRYEPNGLLIDNVAFTYLDREFYKDGGHQFNFGIHGAVEPEVEQVIIEDEGLAITGLENRVDYVVDQGHYGQDELKADWTSFQWARKIQTQTGATHRQELRYSTLAIGVQVETDAPSFAFSYGREEEINAPVAALALSRDGPVIVQAANGGNLAEHMHEDWLILFSGENRGEVPMMLVFSRRPDRVEWDGRELVVHRADGVGTIAIGSPFGAPLQPANLASEWRADESRVPLEHLRAAADLLKAYPWKCEENFAVKDGEVWIQNLFEFLPWQSEWEGAPPQPQSPLPPLIAYSIEQGYLPEETAADLQDTGIPTKWGSLWTKPGNELVYRLPIPRAWDWFPLATEPVGDEHQKIHANLTERSFTPKAFKVLRRPVVEAPRHPHYVAQDFSASAWRATGYMTEEQRADFTELTRARVWHSLFPQSYRLRVDPITGAQYLGCTFVWNKPDRVNAEGFADIDYWQGLTIYGLYTHAKYAGDWELMEQNWPAIRSLLSYWEALNSWALMGPGAREAGEMYHADMATAGYAGLIGYYRLAEKLGTPYQSDLGAYLLAKNAVPSTAKFGFGKWANQLSHREFVRGRSSSGFGERWVASFPGITPDRSDYRSGDVWWLTGCVGPLSAQIEAIDLWMERAPAEAAQFQENLRGQISDAKLLQHDSRRVIPHLMLRGFLGGKWLDNATNLYARYHESYLLRDVHGPASLLSHGAKAWLLDWSTAVISEATWSEEHQRAAVTMKANSPATLAWAVTSAPRQVILNEKDIEAVVRESQNGWHTLKVPVETGDHRVELIW